MSGERDPWGGRLWAAADLITPMAPARGGDAAHPGQLRRRGTPDGRVLVIETLDTDGAANTHMDLRMLAYVNGRERSLDDLVALGHEVGLAVDSVTPAGRGTIIEFSPRR